MQKIHDSTPGIRVFPTGEDGGSPPYFGGSTEIFMIQKLKFVKLITAKVKKKKVKVTVKKQLMKSKN